VIKSGGREMKKKNKDVEREKKVKKKNDSTGTKEVKNVHRRVKALTLPSGSRGTAPSGHYPLWATQIICLDKRKTKKKEKD
jgi:hypothetical protein